MSDHHDPAEAETTGADTITVTYDGRSWTFPPGLDNLRYSQIEAFESNKLTEFLPSVLPRDEMKVIKSADFDMKWLRGLVDAWAEAGGFADLGE